MDAHGADAVRWFFAASGSPWATRRVGHATLEEIVRKVLLTYWNTVSFLVLYANAAARAGRRPGAPARLASAPPPADRPVLDRWLLSELHTLVRDVTAALEDFDTAAGRAPDRRVHRRPVQLVRAPVAAPVLGGPGHPGRRGGVRHAVRVPGDADQADGPDDAVPDRLRLGRAARREDAPDSVHLATWPAADASADRRAPVRADGAGPAPGGARPLGPRGGRRCGSASRWPARARSARPGSPTCPPTCAPRSPTSSTCARWTRSPPCAEDLVDYTVKPNFRALGGRFGKGTPAVAAAIEAADPAALAAELRSGGQGLGRWWTGRR